jgi:hypothetical protein
LCSSDFEFGNRFGASQIIEYTNDKQGKITLSAAGPEYSATLEVTIALTGGKAKASIKKLTSLTSFNGFIDWTDDITKNSPIIFVFPVEVDLFERRRHTVYIEVQAGACSDTFYGSFVTGDSTPYPVSSDSFD